MPSEGEYYLCPQTGDSVAFTDDPARMRNSCTPCFFFGRGPHEPLHCPFGDLAERCSECGERSLCTNECTMRQPRNNVPIMLMATALSALGVREEEGPVAIPALAPLLFPNCDRLLVDHLVAQLRVRTFEENGRTCVTWTIKGHKQLQVAERPGVSLCVNRLIEGHGPFLSTAGFPATPRALRPEPLGTGLFRAQVDIVTCATEPQISLSVIAEELVLSHRGGGPLPEEIARLQNAEQPPPLLPQHPDPVAPQQQPPQQVGLVARQHQPPQQAGAVVHQHQPPQLAGLVAHQQQQLAAQQFGAPGGVARQQQPEPLAAMHYGAVGGVAQHPLHAQQVGGAAHQHQPPPAQQAWGAAAPPLPDPQRVGQGPYAPVPVTVHQHGYYQPIWQPGQSMPHQPSAYANPALFQQQQVFQQQPQYPQYPDPAYGYQYQAQAPPFAMAPAAAAHNAVDQYGAVYGSANLPGKLLLTKFSVPAGATLDPSVAHMLSNSLSFYTSLVTVAGGSATKHGKIKIPYVTYDATGMPSPASASAQVVKVEAHALNKAIAAVEDNPAILADVLRRHASDALLIQELARRAQRAYLLPFVPIPGSTSAFDALSAAASFTAIKVSRGVSWKDLMGALHDASKRNALKCFGEIASAAAPIRYLSPSDPSMVAPIALLLPAAVPAAAPEPRPKKAKSAQPELCRNFSSGASGCKFTADGNQCRFVHNCPCGAKRVNPATHTCAKRPTANTAVVVA